MAALFIDSSNNTNASYDVYTTGNSIYNSTATNEIANTTDSAIESVVSKYLYEPMTQDLRVRLQNDLNITCGSLYNTNNNVNYSEYQYNSTIYINNCTYHSGSDYRNYFSLPPVDPAEKKKFVFREKIRNQLIFTPKTKAEPLTNVEGNETVAIETLREMITEEEFKRFINRGFITVTGRSGKVYQIFRNNWHTKVWVGGQLVEEVCVRIRGDVGAPATDNLIAFKAMIEADEEEFRSLGNVYKFNRRAA